ncbi:MAG: hypothetical protein V3W04_04105 [Gammaproteobacteria bacterium]
MEDSLEKLITVISDNPAAAESLSLYALVCTLRVEKGGYMYRLSKLQELSAGNRELAYALMELMASRQNQGDEWDKSMELLDNLIRGR